MPRNGGASVGRADIRGELAVCFVRAPDQQNRVAILESMRHRHEVVLSADTAQNASIFQSIRGHRARERDDEPSIHEPGLLSLQAFELLVPVELVHERNAGHADLLSLGLVHPTQSLVEALGTQEETRVRHVQFAVYWT